MMLYRNSYLGLTTTAFAVVRLARVPDSIPVLEECSETPMLSLGQQPQTGWTLCTTFSFTLATHPVPLFFPFLLAFCSNLLCRVRGMGKPGFFLYFFILFFPLVSFFILFFSSSLFFSDKPISHSAGHNSVWILIFDITFQDALPWFHPITLVNHLSSMPTTLSPSWVPITFTCGRVLFFFCLGNSI